MKHDIITLGLSLAQEGCFVSKSLRSTARFILGFVLASACCSASVYVMWPSPVSGDALTTVLGGVLAPFPLIASCYLLWWLFTHQWDVERAAPQKPAAEVFFGVDKVGQPQLHDCDEICEFLKTQLQDFAP